MLQDLLQQTGPLGGLQLAVLAFAVLLAAERSQALMFRYSLDAPAFLDQLENLLEARNLERAQRLVSLHARAPLARVGAAVLGAWEEGERSVQRALDWSAAEQRMVVMTRVGWFKTLGVISALLGVAGVGLAATWPMTQKASSGGDTETLLLQALDRGGATLFLGALGAALCFLFHLVLGSYAKRMALYLEVGAKRLSQVPALEQGAGGREAGK